MMAFFTTLTEKDRRRYAAMEAVKLGYGGIEYVGIEYVANLLGCSRRTVEHGIKELDVLHEDPAEGRVRQFRYITRLRKTYETQGNPVFSIDTKKKEHLGLLYREGRVYCQEAFHAFDHDFPSWAVGKIVCCSTAFQQSSD